MHVRQLSMYIVSGKQLSIVLSSSDRHFTVLYCFAEKLITCLWERSKNVNQNRSLSYIEGYSMICEGYP